MLSAPRSIIIRWYYLVVNCCAHAKRRHSCRQTSLSRHQSQQACSRHANKWPGTPTGHFSSSIRSTACCKHRNVACCKHRNVTQ